MMRNSCKESAHALGDDQSVFCDTSNSASSLNKETQSTFYHIFSDTVTRDEWTAYVNILRNEVELLRFPFRG